MLYHEDGTMIDSFSFGQQLTNLPSARKPNGLGGFVSQSHTFASNNNLVNTVDETSTKAFFNVYPNPAHDQIVIEFEKNMLNNHKIFISLYDALGRSLTTGLEINSYNATISTASLESGYYYLKANIDGKGTFMKKVVVIH